MSYGLKGKVKEIVTELNALRQNKERPRDIGLRQFMADRFPNDGNPLTPEHLYQELGIEPQYTQVKDLYAQEDTSFLMSEIVRDGVRRGMGLTAREQQQALKQAIVSQGPVTIDRTGNQRWLNREVFLEPVMTGAVQTSFYQDLVVGEEPVSQPTVTVPKVDLSDAKMQDTEEAATIEEGSVTYGSKQVTLKNKSTGLKVSYDAIQFNSLSLAQIYFLDVGRILAHTLNNMAIDALVDGDQADLSENAAVVGVEVTANKITWYDLTRIAIRFSLLGRTTTVAIGNETTALDYLNLSEVKNKQFPGAPLLATMMKTLLTMPESLYASQRIAANKLLLLDPSMSLVQLTAVPLMVETEKIISKRLEAAYASYYTGFAKLQRNASVIVDGSILFSGNGFPAFMSPYSG